MSQVIEASSFPVIDMKAVSLMSSLCHDSVDMIESAILKSDINCVDSMNEKFLNDHSCNGLYARALMIKKGTFLTGRVHKNDYIDICVYGDITVKSFLFDGTIEDSERITSFKFLNGKKGRKRVGFAHEDTLWLTVDHLSCSDCSPEDDISVPNLKDYNRMIEGIE